MSNFKVNITIGDVSKNMIVKYKTTNDIKDDNFDNILNDLGLEKVSYNELVPKCEKIKHKHEDECPICSQDYKIGEFKRKLSCNHEYHKKCIDKWLKDYLTCPICRKEIKSL